MNALASVQYFVFGIFASTLVVARPLVLIVRFRQALRDSAAASGQSGSAVALFVTMVLLNPQLWLTVALVVFGFYYLYSHALSASTISFLWGLAAGTPIMWALTLLVQRRRKRLASAKSSASSHVA
jgi:hypothetical protein